MAIDYTNRKGQQWYLHVSKTRKGHLKYFFSHKSEGSLATMIPEGYEIYEHPNAQVFLRRIQSRLITETEQALVEKGLEHYTDLRYYRIDIKKDTIFIYTADEDVDEMMDIFKRLNPFNVSERVKQEMLHYTPVLLFQLVDAEHRLFIPQRFCYLGAIDDWIVIGEHDTLEQHIKRFVPHLGKDSFYELI